MFRVKLFSLFTYKIGFLLLQTQIEVDLIMSH